MKGWKDHESCNEVRWVVVVFKKLCDKPKILKYREKMGGCTDMWYVAVSGCVRTWHGRFTSRAAIVH
jgi:hypothetical protein